MTITAKQEWCPLCSMVHEPNLHIHEQLEQMKEDISHLCGKLEKASICEIDSYEYEKNIKLIENIRNKYNV